MSDAAAANDHLAELESELDRLSKSVNEIHAAQEAASKAVSASKSVLSSLAQVSKDHQEQYASNKALNDRMHDVLDNITRVDFPSRLDKLDNTVSAVSIGVQNLGAGIRDLSQKFEGIEDLLASLYRGLMVQRGISLAVAALVVGGLIASLLLR